jgi:hypothetical protein
MQLMQHHAHMLCTRDVVGVGALNFFPWKHKLTGYFWSNDQCPHVC